MTQFRTLYDTLGVTRNADPAVIKAAYKALVNQYHPDKNPNRPEAEEMMKRINRAYEILSNPTKRAEYDRWLNEHERKQQQNAQNHHANAYQRRGGQTNASQQQGYSNPYQQANQSGHNRSARTQRHAPESSFWSIHGRMRRTQYIVLSSITVFFLIITKVLLESEGGFLLRNGRDITGFFVFISIIFLLLYAFFCFISAKRLHDFNCKGGWTLISLIGVGMILLTVILWFIPPTKNTNRFGVDPRGIYDDDYDGEFEKDYSCLQVSGFMLLFILGNIALVSQGI